MSRMHAVALIGRGSDDKVLTCGPANSVEESMKKSRKLLLRAFALTIGLLTVTATVGRAETQVPAPPYLQTGAQFITVGVTYDETALRKLLPKNVNPTPKLTGGINIYHAPAGYSLAPYSSAYLWVDIEGYDSADGTKGRWMLQGMYGPEPVPTAVRENLGWPVRAGGSRLETTERGKRGVGLLGDREVMSVEIKPGAEPCQAVKGTLNYLSLVGAAKKLVVNEIPYIGEFCGAEAIAVRVQAPDGDLLNTIKPNGVLWAGELKNATFAFSRPKPIE